MDTEIKREMSKMERFEKIIVLCVYELMAFLVSDICLCLIAYGIYARYLQEGMTGILILFTYGLSVAVAGFLAGRKMGKNGFLWGLLEGMGYFLLVMLLSVFFGMKEISITFEWQNVITILIICIFTAMLSGIAGEKQRRMNKMKGSKEASKKYKNKDI